MQQNSVMDVTLFQPSGALQDFTQTNPDALVILNGPGGTVTIPSDYDGKGRPIGIINEGNVEIKDVSANCAFCGIRFDNQTLLDQHHWSAFKRCSVHKLCFDNWTQHNNDHQHTICGVEGCAGRGTNFGSNYRYLAHWQSTHNNHCQAEQNRIGRGFCQPCYWQHTYSHDKNVSACKS